ncbi:MAG: XrtA system polysaccharide chain length determinant [Gammaproteobacteria bacterium]
MREILDTVLDHLRGAWRFRWPAMLVSWCICIAGWAYIMMIPDTYEASARVFVDTRTALSQAIRGITVETSVDTQIARIRQAMLGGPQLEKVARETGLDTNVVTAPQRQALVNTLRERVRISGGWTSESAGTYVISFDDRDRDRSLRVVDRLLSAFVEGAQGGNREGSRQAQRFLVDQIAEYERRLSAAEEKLANFKKENVGLMPGAQGDYFSRLQNQMEALNKSQGSLKVALERREAIQRQLRGEQPLLPNDPRTAVPGSLAAGGGETATRIRETQARLDELLLRFTDKYPDVVALRTTLRDLEARQKAEIEAARHGDSAAAANSGLGSNPVFQSIQLQLNQADIDIASLRAEISDRQSKVSELRKLVDTAPEVEAEFSRLNRDYDVTRAQYQSLVERLEKTKFSDEADKTGFVDFAVIDPPSSPFKPVAPNRQMLIFAVLILGLGAGGLVAYALHQIKPVFNTARQLAAITGLPVLGEVSRTWLEKYGANRRKAVFGFAGAGAGLVVAAVAVLLVHGRLVEMLRGLIA